MHPAHACCAPKCIDSVSTRPVRIVSQVHGMASPCGLDRQPNKEHMNMDRREFLKHTALLGAGPLLFGAPAVARAVPPSSPNEKVRFACIGVGGKGDSDTNDAGDHGEIVALCDID